MAPYVGESGTFPDTPAGRAFTHQADCDVAQEFERHRVSLEAYCAGKTRDPVAAQDIVQDTFLKLQNGRVRWDPSKPMWPLLVKVATRACTDAFRRQSYAESRLADMAEARCATAPDTESVVFDRLTCERLHRAVETLPTRQKVAIQLFALDDWSYAEVAAYLGVSVAVVKSLIQRARARLRESTTRLAGSALGGLRSWQAWLHEAVRRVRDAGVGLGGSASPAVGWAQGQVLAGAMALAMTAVVAGPAVPHDGRTQRAALGGRATAAPDAPVAGESTAERHRTVLVPSEPLHQDAVAAAERTINHAAEPVLDQHPAGPHPEDGYVSAVAASPGYEQDHTVVASSAPPAPVDGFAGSPRFVVSRDGGATWERQRSLGFGGAYRILFAPAYPVDNRIFTVGLKGLQMTRDGGETFETLVPRAAVDADISPRFDDGDPRLLLVGAEGQVHEFHYDTGLVRLVHVLEQGFTSYLDDARFEWGATGKPRIVLAGHRVAADGGATGRAREAFYRRCASSARLPTTHTAPSAVALLDDCETITLPSRGVTSLTLPDVVPAVGPAFLGQGFDIATVTGHQDRFTTSFAPPGSGFNIWVSTLRVLPGGDGSAALASAGRALASDPVLLRTDDAGRTWKPFSIDLPGFASGASDLAVAPTGRLFAVGNNHGLACSADDGRTWAPRCPRAEGDQPAGVTASTGSTP